LHKRQRIARREQHGSGAGNGKASDVEISGGGALDFAGHGYMVSIDGLGASQPLIRGGAGDRGYMTARTQCWGRLTAGGDGVRVFAPTAHAVSVVLYDKAAGDDGRMIARCMRRGKGFGRRR